MNKLEKDNSALGNKNKQKQQKMKSKIQNLQKEQGITLVALVLTIIIIIILATVAINFAFGDNGLINRAEQAKDFYANDTKYTEGSMTNVESYLDDILAGTGSSGEGEETPEPPAPDIPGGSEAIEQGAISFTNLVWSNEQASVTISTNTSYAMQYQVVAEEGASNEENWQAVPEGGVIGNLNHLDVVYARLVQGTTYGEEASTTVKDEDPPTISNIETSNITYDSVTVAVTASDGQSGLATSGTYKYYLNSESSPRETNTTGSYTFTGLSAETGYTIKVVVADKAGNEATETTTVTTVKQLATNVNELKAGDLVNYVDGTGVTRQCVVLYDSSSSYGVEIITMESVEYVELGNGTGSFQANNTTYFNTAMNSYNNAIETLNDATAPYNNSTYSSRARCVGSDPSNPTSDSPGYFTSSYSYMASYNGQFKNQDTHYETDYNQMGTLGIREINGIYWLASRYVGESSIGSLLSMRYVNASGNLCNDSLCYVGSSGRTNSHSDTYGLRPVFLLRSNIKVTGGTGEDGSPYTLGT